jgi:CBS domain-containing protein
LPVVDGKSHCVGIVSTTDLIELTRDLEDDLNELDDAGELNRRWLLTKLRSGTGHEKVAEVMSDQLTYAGPETPVRTAVRQMIRHRVHHLPVLDEQRRLVGIISTMDVLSAIAD